MQSIEDELKGQIEGYKQRKDNQSVELEKAASWVKDLENQLVSCWKGVKSELKRETAIYLWSNKSIFFLYNIIWKKLNAHRASRSIYF